MWRMTEKRESINIRISRPALDAVEQRAKKDARPRSEMIRFMLAYAQQNMPAGWKP